MSEPVFSPAPNVVRRSAVADLVEHLVRQTTASGMSAGDRLPPERQLGEQLGVSRSTLREALKCLDVLGFIEIRQGDGTYLSGNAASLLSQSISWGLLLGSREAKELIEARHFVETALAELAAARRSEHDLADLAALVEAMDQADSPQAFAQADADFHLAISRASGNAPLRAVLESIKSLLDAWILRVAEATADWTAIVAQHRDIAAAIAAGDGQEAARCMRHHIGHVADLLAHAQGTSIEGA